MKALNCCDLGAEDYFIATGNSDEEVVEKMIKHARSKHKEKFNNLNKKEEKKILEIMKKKIYTY
ncbi:MAG: DUF1059 domain-containing protein [Candidatus Woesearchaeota archaeon]|jgi:predicted small metal-binding protein|nr:DUF1059 domain-containing protein [Candidatus Woesearchaeota archaeon]